ncbi:hypothetical protein IV203_015675 [Nitzschia inconspicua]|uniref:Uncharacterized protein n=1 Tax=Nitzschia inconspicua TaxID=303405 RepID=A0A9K3LE19_9STRA|nr:hypothetical protein IV203_015675 [Nitzschia inconspicua]
MTAVAFLSITSTGKRIRPFEIIRHVSLCILLLVWILCCYYKNDVYAFQNRISGYSLSSTFQPWGTTKSRHKINTVQSFAAESSSESDDDDNSRNDNNDDKKKSNEKDDQATTVTNPFASPPFPSTSINITSKTTDGSSNDAASTFSSYASLASISFSTFKSNTTSNSSKDKPNSPPYFSTIEEEKTESLYATLSEGSSANKTQTSTTNSTTFSSSTVAVPKQPFGVSPKSTIPVAAASFGVPKNTTIAAVKQTSTMPFSNANVSVTAKTGISPPFSSASIDKKDDSPTLSFPLENRTQSAADSSNNGGNSNTSTIPPFAQLSKSPFPAVPKASASDPFDTTAIKTASNAFPSVSKATTISNSFNTTANKTASNPSPSVTKTTTSNPFNTNTTATKTNPFPSVPRATTISNPFNTTATKTSSNPFPSVTKATFSNPFNTTATKNASNPFVPKATTSNPFNTTATKTASNPFPSVPKATTISNSFNTTATKTASNPFPSVPRATTSNPFNTTAKTASNPFSNTTKVSSTAFPTVPKTSATNPFTATNDQNSTSPTVSNKTSFLPPISPSVTTDPQTTVAGDHGSSSEKKTDSGMEFSYASLASLSKKKDTDDTMVTESSNNKTTAVPTSMDPTLTAQRTIESPAKEDALHPSSLSSSEAQKEIPIASTPVASPVSKEEQEEPEKSDEFTASRSTPSQPVEMKEDVNRTASNATTTSTFAAPPRIPTSETPVTTELIDTNSADSFSSPVASFTPPSPSLRVNYDQGRVLDVASISTPEESAASLNEKKKREADAVASSPFSKDRGNNNDTTSSSFANEVRGNPYQPTKKEGKSSSTSSKPLSVTELWEITGSGSSSKAFEEKVDDSTRGVNGSSSRRESRSIDVIGIDAEVVIPSMGASDQSYAYRDAVVDAIDEEDGFDQGDDDWDDDIEEFPAREERAIIYDQTDDRDEDYDDYYGEPEEYYDEEEDLEEYDFAFAPRSEEDDYYDNYDEGEVTEEEEEYWDDEYDEYDEGDAENGYWEDPPIIDQYDDEDDIDSYEDDYVPGEEVGPFVVSDPPQAPENFGAAVAAAAMAKTGGPIPDTAFMPPEVQKQLSQNPVISVVSTPSRTRQSPLNENDVPSLAKKNQAPGPVVTGNMMTPRIRKPSDSTSAASTVSGAAATQVPAPTPAPAPQRNFEVSGAAPPTFGKAVADAASGLSGGIGGQPKQNAVGMDLVDDVAMKFYRRTWKQLPPE